MKYLLTSLLFLLTCSMRIVAQNDEVIITNMPIDKDSKLITYKEVISEKGNQQELYDRGFLWFNKFFKNPSDVIREKDAENGKIKGITRMQLYNIDKDVRTKAGVVEFTIITEFKDGRYRYNISNFNLKQASYFPLERWLDDKDPAFSANCEKHLDQIDEYIKDLIKNLKKAMKPFEKKSDDW